MFARDSESNDVSLDHRALWAKSDPYHPLWKHLLDVAAVSLSLPNPLNEWDWTVEQVALIVGLHDVGKADACFQHQGFLEGEKLKELREQQNRWLLENNHQTLPLQKWPEEAKSRRKKIAAADAAAISLSAGFVRTMDARCRHERLSAKFIRDLLQGSCVSDRDVDTIGRALVAHHGYWDEGARPVGAEYQNAQSGLLGMLLCVLELTDTQVPAISEHSSFGMRLAGHIVLCDWIASNEGFYQDDRLARIDDPKEYFEKAKEVALTWIQRLGLERTAGEGKPKDVVNCPRPIQQALLDSGIPPGLVIIEAPMGEGKTEAAWILAEKWRDHGCHGVFMALPTMATSDSLFGRYRDDYLWKLERGEAAHLIHGMAWLRDENEPERPPNVGEPGDDRSLAAAWFRPTRKAMLAAHGVGTVDQAMLAGMHVKFGFLRLFGLADRVLVIDEVHAYDAYMSAIICRLLQWCACLEIPVVLLSATLSGSQRAAMIEAYSGTPLSAPEGEGAGGEGSKVPYPLITVCPLSDAAAFTIPKDTGPTLGVSSTRMLQMKTHAGMLGDAKATAAKAKELVKDGGCCCMILNTVKQAQAVFAALGKDIPKLLFHARFTADDRERISKEVIRLFGKGRWEGKGDERIFKPAERPAKFILVATQVVEQSLDVDFDHMISEIAPMDLLLQRSGRIKRHVRSSGGEVKVAGDDERGDPVLHVLLPEAEKKKKDGTSKGVDKPDFKASEKIYQRYPLLTTIAQLTKSNGDDEVAVDLPADFRKLIEATYSDAVADGASDDIKEAKSKWEDLQVDLAAQAGEFLLCEPMDDEFDPVGHDEVGDDSDDGNGWRARTRLGLEDVLVIPLKPEQIERWKSGDLHPRLVMWLYKRSVKIPPYHWPPREATGFKPAVLGKKKLKGVWLLPVKKDGDGWKWQGKQEKGGTYTIKYDPCLGLTSENDKKEKKKGEDAP